MKGKNQQQAINRDDAAPVSKRKQSHQIQLQSKEYASFRASQKTAFQVQFYNKASQQGFVEKTYRPKAQPLKKLELINRFIFSGDFYQDALTPFLNQYPEIFQKEVSIPSNFQEFKLDSNNCIYKKASKKQKMKLLEQQRINEEAERKREMQESEQFLRKKKHSCDYHDLKMFKQLNVSSKSPDEEQLEGMVFDSVQLIKNKLKDRRNEEEDTLVEDDNKGLEQLDMECKLGEQIFPPQRPANRVSLFMLFTKMVTKLSVEQKVWYYKDPNHVIQGPFSAVQLDRWNHYDFFPDALPVSWLHKNEFITMKNFREIPELIVFTTEKYKRISHIIRMEINQLDSTSILNCIQFNKIGEEQSSAAETNLVSQMRKISVDQPQPSMQLDPLMMDTQQLRNLLQI